LIRDPERREYLEYLSLGAEIAMGLSLPLFLGYWLDGRLGTSPWLLLVGALTGIFILIGLTIRIANRSNGKDRGS